MTELEELKAEVLKYKVLFVAAVGHYGQTLPREEQIAIAPTVIATMTLMADDWYRLYGESEVPDVLINELQQIGASHG